MEFNRASEAMEYIKENHLYDVPVSVEWHLDKKPKLEVWFGSMEFGRFTIGNDYFEMCIVNDICEKIVMDDNDNAIEDYLSSNGYVSYVIPEQYEGQIVYSQDYLGEKEL
jgi:hypothetical protein